MKKRLTLTDHLQSVIKELKAEGKQVMPDFEADTYDKIESYLNEKVSEDAHNILNAVKLVRDKFKTTLIEEIIVDMSDEEDYLNETINKKVNKKITNHINNWLVQKMKNNE
tara:strand:+ start:690 stop:1022 length:333 start_codon:yes stop_codon:yes gene_type:complete